MLDQTQPISKTMLEDVLALCPEGTTLDAVFEFSEYSSKYQADVLKVALSYDAQGAHLTLFVKEKKEVPKPTTADTTNVEAA